MCEPDGEPSPGPGVLADERDKVRHCRRVKLKSIAHTLLERTRQRMGAENGREHGDAGEQQPDADDSVGRVEIVDHGVTE